MAAQLAIHSISTEFDVLPGHETGGKVDQVKANLKDAGEKVKDAFK